jgi:hypothetical protein
VDSVVEKHSTSYPQNESCGKMWKTLFSFVEWALFINVPLWIVENFGKINSKLWKNGVIICLPSKV